MTWRLLASYLALTIVVLVALEVPLAIVYDRDERQDLTSKVQRDAFAAASLAEDALQSGHHSPALERSVKNYQAQTGGRVVVVDRSGDTLADSSGAAASGGRTFAKQAEIVSALRGLTVSGIRSSADGPHVLYVSIPVKSSGAVFGAVRITYPTSELDRRLKRYRVALVAVALVVLGVAALIGLLLARSIARPLRRLEGVAARVGAGELSARAAEDDGPNDVRRLAGEFNRTTAKLAALLRSQEQFVADASHELWTPLTALRLRLENGEAEAGLIEVERLAGLSTSSSSSRGRTPRAVPVAICRSVTSSAGVSSCGRPREERGVTLEAHADGAVVRAGKVASSRCSTTCCRTRSTPRRPAPKSTSPQRRAAQVTDEGSGLSSEQRDRAFDRSGARRRRPAQGSASRSRGG